VQLWSARTLLWRGDLRDAQERLEAARERFAQWGRRRSRETYGAAYLAGVLTLRGDLAGARRVLDEDAQQDDDGSDGFAQIIGSQAQLLVAEGRHAEALAATERLAQFELTIGGFPGWPPWRSLRARALAALGRADEAMAIAQEEVELARRFGAAGVVGQSLRAAGEVDPEHGVERLREAVETLERSTARYELAATLVSLGRALRLARHPSDARDPLRRALELAHRCGADALVEQARAELYATGVRPRNAERSGPASLTASERRVAELAADGRTNKEIAQELYVTLKTVEVHLSSSYRKLGISSRRDLETALAS